MRVVWMSLLLSMVLAVPVTAQQWHVRPEASTLGFEFRQEGAKYQGLFQKFDADINFDPNNLATAQVDVMIDLGSVSAGSAERDEALVSSAFFAIKMFPQASFTSAAFRHIDGQRYEVDGELIIRGLRQHVTMPFTLRILDENAYMEGQFVLNRLDFKLGEGFWADENFIGHEIVIMVKLNATSGAL